MTGTCCAWILNQLSVGVTCKLREERDPVWACVCVWVMATERKQGVSDGAINVSVGLIAGLNEGLE